MPVIEYAEETLYRWLEQNFPRITDHHSPEDMISLRKQFMLQDELFAVDMTLMRSEFLKQVARDAGYDPTAVSVAGFAVFYEARQQVNFYDDVLPCLERLQSKYRLGAISNGNANVEKVGLGTFIRAFRQRLGIKSRQTR